MLNRTRYRRLSRLMKALADYLSQHPESANLTVTQLMEELTLHELPELAPLIEPKKERRSKQVETNSASETEDLRDNENVRKKEKEKTKKKNALPPDPFPKEKEINKEKEFLTPSPRAHEEAAGKAKADRNLALQNFEGWCEADFKKQLLRFADRYPIRLLSKFFYYWADRTTDGRMRLQLQQTFDLEKRLAAWASKESNFCKSTGGSNGNTAPAEICSQFALNQEAIPAYPERLAATNGRKAARSFDAFGTGGSNGNTAPAEICSQFALNQEAIPAYPERLAATNGRKAARSFDAFGTPDTLLRCLRHSRDGCTLLRWLRNIRGDCTILRWLRNIRGGCTVYRHRPHEPTEPGHGICTRRKVVASFVIRAIRVILVASFVIRAIRVILQSGCQHTNAAHRPCSLRRLVQSVYFLELFFINTTISSIP